MTYSCHKSHLTFIQIYSSKDAKLTQMFSSFSHNFISNTTSLDSLTYILVISNKQSFLYQDLKVTGPLGENFNFFSPIRFDIQGDSKHLTLTIKFHLLRALKWYRNKKDQIHHNSNSLVGGLGDPPCHNFLPLNLRFFPPQKFPQNNYKNNRPLSLNNNLLLKIPLQSTSSGKPCTRLKNSNILRI